MNRVVPQTKRGNWTLFSECYKNWHRTMANKIKIIHRSQAGETLAWHVLFIHSEVFSPSNHFENSSNFRYMFKVNVGENEYTMFWRVYVDTCSVHMQSHWSTWSAVTLNHTKLTKGPGFPITVQ